MDKEHTECKNCVWLIETADENRFFCGCEKSYQYELEVDAEDNCGHFEYREE